MRTLSLFIVVSILCQFIVCDDICLDGSTPVASSTDLPVCCWYDESCCNEDSPELQLIELIVDSVYEILDDYQNVTHASTHDVQKCTAYIESLFCLGCAPDLGNYLVEDEEGNFTLTLCQSWCDDFYDSCEIFFSTPGSNMTATSGTELCESLNEGGSYVYGDYIVVASSDCLAGASSDTVGSATCNPWKGEDYETTSGSNFWYFFLVFIGIAVILCVVCGVALVIGGVVYYKKKQQASQQASSEPYPQLDELE